MKTLSIFGATGSVGTSTLDIIRAFPEKFNAGVLTAHSNWKKLVELAHEFKPHTVVISDDRHYDDLTNALGEDINVLTGEGGLIEASEMPCNLYMASIVGIAGLKPLFAAVKSGHTIALANKEALVCAGTLLLDAAKKHQVDILPVDSEHNAIFQVLERKNRVGVERVILTASGGPFRDKTRNDLNNISIEQALKHPNWSMGAKISIDSATMANKSLEMVEAVYLFDLKPHELDVLIHPQSIIHSMVEYKDGSILAQMGAPDMKVPIGYAMNWPKRDTVNSQRLKFDQIDQLTFRPVDTARFKTVGVMQQIIQDNLQQAIIFNAANEVAVDAFLKQKIAFLEIETMIETCLDQVNCPKIDSLDDIMALDIETRHHANHIIDR